jgi:Bacteriophage protein gp37
MRPDPLLHTRYWDRSENYVGGCVMADYSCRYCYAAHAAHGLQSATGNALHSGTTKLVKGIPTFTGHFTERAADDDKWKIPLRWKGVEKPLLGPDKPALFWANSMADLFAPGRPLGAVDRILRLIALSDHIGVVLTKFPKGMVDYFADKPAFWRRRFLLGFSVPDQSLFNVRWPIMRPLAESDWRVFVSLAPLLAPVVLPSDFLKLGRWVIVSGEQAPGDRPMLPDWARALRDQAKAADLPFFLKEMGRGWIPRNLQIWEFPKV